MTEFLIVAAVLGIAGYYVYKNYGSQVSAAVGSAVKTAQLDALGLADDSPDGGG